MHDSQRSAIRHAMLAITSPAHHTVSQICRPRHPSHVRNAPANETDDGAQDDEVVRGGVGAERRILADSVSHARGSLRCLMDTPHTGSPAAFAKGRATRDAVRDDGTTADDASPKRNMVPADHPKR